MRHLGITPHPKQQQLFDAIDRGAKSIGTNAGTGSGKTLPGAIEVLKQMAYPPEGHHADRTIPITAPWKELTDRAFRIVWDAIVNKQVFSCLTRKGFMPSDKSKRERYIEMPWGARTVGYSMESADANIGDRWPFVLCDEFARWKEGVYEDTIERAMTDYGGGTALLITTPNPRGGMNHHWAKRFKNWSALSETDDRYFTLHYTSYDNPYLDHATLDRIAEEYRRIGMYDRFRREYLAEFLSMAGGVWPTFRPEKGGAPWHVGHYPYLPGQPIIGSIDWGYDHPFVCHLGHLLDGDRPRIFKSISVRGLNPMEQVEAVTRAIKEVDPENEPIELVDMLYCDPSGAASKKLFRDAGYPVYEPSTKERLRLNAVMDGITEVAKCFAREDIPGIEIDSRCVELINGIQGYIWNERAIDERPVKIDDDECDALRYLVMGAIGLNSEPVVMFF